LGFPDGAGVGSGKGEVLQMQGFEKGRGAPLRDGREKSPGGFRGREKGGVELPQLGGVWGGNPMF